MPRKKVRPRPASGFYGVIAARLRWKATITYDKEQHYLGHFDTKQEAALTYDRAARQYGKGKLLNYKSIAAAEEAAVQAQAEHKLILPQQPKPRRGITGFYGVYATGKRWASYIRHDSKRPNLGTFDTKQEAALAYDRAARQFGKDRPHNYESIAAAEEAAAQAQAEHKLELPPSGFYGVAAKGKRWQARIGYDGKQHHLGTFDTKQEAALAYDRQARQCGKDTPLNYESIAAAEEAAAQAQAEHKLMHPHQPKPRRPPSGFHGVSPDDNKNRWQARIGYDGKQHHLGTFDTKQQAALAYDREARQCGEDKPLNYKSIAAAEEAAAQAQAEHILVHDMCAGPNQPKPRPAEANEIEAPPPHHTPLAPPAVGQCQCLAGPGCLRLDYHVGELLSLWIALNPRWIE
jgi:hypothetical protein